MSTSLERVIENGGYDLTTKDDCHWLLGTQDEYADLIAEAENRLEEIEAEELENCEHDDTYIEEIEDTEAYELGNAVGSNPILHTSQIEICEKCGKQRNLPEGDWENV